MVTLAGMLTETWSEMVQKSTSSTYTAPKLTKALNKLGGEIYDKQVFNELTRTFIQVSDTPFANNLAGIQLLTNPVTTAAIAVGDVEIFFNTTDLAISGKIRIGGDVITYTGKTATSITGVTGILLAHDSGSVVEVLYTLSSDFNKPLKFYNRNNMKNNYVRGLREGDSLSVYYNIIVDGDTSYLTTSGNLSGAYYLEYTQLYTKLVNQTDESVLPDDIAEYIMPKIVAGRETKDPELKGRLLAEGYGSLTTAINKYSNPSGETKKPRWKRFGFSSIQ